MTTLIKLHKFKSLIREDHKVRSNKGDAEPFILNSTGIDMIVDLETYTLITMKPEFNRCYCVTETSDYIYKELLQRG